MGVCCCLESQHDLIWERWVIQMDGARPYQSTVTQSHWDRKDVGEQEQQSGSIFTDSLDSM